MLNNIPKPLVIGVTIVAVIVAVFFVYKSTMSGGENAGRPSKDEIRAAQEKAAGQQGGGRQMPTGGRR